MDIGWTVAAELLALGAAVGFLAGLLGIGGGMIMVPVLTLLLSQRGVDPGHAVKMSIATSMATILFTSLSSVRAHHRLGTVRWPLAATLAPGIVLGGLAAGAGAFAVLKGRGLAIVFAAFLGYTALRMLRGATPRPDRQLPGRAGLTAVGAGIGFASGLLGAGGAFVSVPYMTRCNVPVREALGTAAALGFPIAAANTVGYAIAGWGVEPALPGAFGYFHLPALAIVAAASVVLAPWGARAAQRIDVRQLRRLFAVLLLGLAATMLYKAWTI